MVKQEYQQPSAIALRAATALQRSFVYHLTTLGGGTRTLGTRRGDQRWGKLTRKERASANAELVDV